MKDRFGLEPDIRYAVRQGPLCADSDLCKVAAIKLGQRHSRPLADFEGVSRCCIAAFLKQTFDLRIIILAPLKTEMPIKAQ
jgi:hypothetical protein